MRKSAKEYEMSESNEGIKEAFSSTTEEVEKQATGLADLVKSKARDVAEQQKLTGADQISGVAGAMEAAAGELHEQMPQAAEYVEKVAGQLSAAASALRERSVDEVLGTLDEFARRQPAMFFAGAVATGFALSRFAKSSANRGS
jgi:hypothetical protein